MLARSLSYSKAWGQPKYVAYMVTCLWTSRENSVLYEGGCWVAYLWLNVFEGEVCSIKCYDHGYDNVYTNGVM